MSTYKKFSILVQFFFQWLLPRAVALALVVWFVYSTLEIGLADPAQIGRDYWDGNFWLLMEQWGEMIRG